MADTESLGDAGVEWLERWRRCPPGSASVRIPTITDPRGTDFAARRAAQAAGWMLDLERRAIAAFEALGVLMTDTCINYQTIMPPVRGEHMAYGDTGVVIYSNSVCGARSNFEGGPSALGAGLTGRTPRYGLSSGRAAPGDVAGRVVVHAARTLTTGARSAALSAAWPATTGRCRRSLGIDRVPSSDELKHFGAALASFGSVALFHMAGITPEATRLERRRSAGELPSHDIGQADIRALQADYAQGIGAVDVVVFSAPQLSLLEMQHAGRMLDGRRADDAAAGRHQPAGEAGCRPHGPDRAHRGRRRHRAVRHVLLPKLRARNGGSQWLAALATNSAKLTNILGGYGYRPVLLSMEECVDAACAGGRLT